MMPARASRGRLLPMEIDQRKSGLALVKRSAWLGTKISFFVLAPIANLIWLGLSWMLMRASWKHGMWPLELIQAADALPRDPGEVSYATKTMRGFLTPFQLVAVGMAFSAITGAVIGSIAAGVRRLRRR
jgi:hypothetical protein